MILAAAWADAVAAGRKLLAFVAGDWATGWVMAAAASKSMGPIIARVVTRIARYG